MSSFDVTAGLRSCIGHKTPKSVKEFLAEFLGTFLLVAFGNASVAQTLLSGSRDFFNINWGYGLAVFFAVLSSAEVSGGHVNPAVTVGMALWGRLPWLKVPIYIVGQYLGAFVGSAVVYMVYSSALNQYESVPSTATASIWATYPGTMVNENGTSITNYLTASNAMADQVFGTMFLLICVCAISDARNNVPNYMKAFFVSLTVLIIGIAFGMNCGYPINPARDLGPRFFTALAGWGSLPFSATTVDEIPYWWIPIVGPHFGAILGLFAYTVLIEMYHKPEKKHSEPIVLQVSSNGVKESSRF